MKGGEEGEGEGGGGRLDGPKGLGVVRLWCAAVCGECMTGDGAGDG